MRILMVNWAKLADGAVGGGGANGYCQGLALELVARGHDVSYLSSGVTYTASADGAGPGECEARRLPDFRGVRVFEVINSPVLAPGIFQFRNPLGEVSSPALEREVARVVSLLAPDVVHFHNIEGFTSGCVAAIREKLPGVKIFFSLHNYHTVCPQVYLMQGGRRLCTSYENGWACTSCIETKDPQIELFKRTHPDTPLPKHVPLPQLGSVWWKTRKPVSATATVPGAAVRSRDDCDRKFDHTIPVIAPARASTPEDSIASNIVLPEPASFLPINNYARRRAAMVEMISSCDRVLAVSDFVRQKFEALGVQPKPMRVMSIGSWIGDRPQAADNTQPHTAFGSSDRPLRIVFMGYHNFYKGLHVLLAALETLAEGVLGRIELHVYAKDYQPIEHRLQRLGTRLAGLKLLDGYTPDEIPLLLQGKDLGVVPSVWWDNGPQTVMEFMACGLPVIGAELGGIPEWIRHGENGWLFPGNDAPSLATIIDKLVRDPAELRHVAARVSLPKGMKAHGREMEREYASVLGIAQSDSLPTPAQSTTPAAEATTRTVTAIIPTWNRPEEAMAAVRAVQGQVVAGTTFEIVVIDNGSTPQLVEQLERELQPDTVLLNAAAVTEMPRLNESPRTGKRVTLIKNAANLGGTGGFLAGLVWAKERIAEAAAKNESSARFVWLIDDDAVPAPDACEKMLNAMALAPDVGLVGARSIDPDRPTFTLETTVYFNPKSGHLSDYPHTGHRMELAHRAWISKVGTTRSEATYTGVIETDIAAACCLLAKAEVLEKVGLWDPRYFIYEDDADWCLRAAKSGYRVLMCLDATVKHKTWHAKLSFQRLAFWLYQSTRNRMWTFEKVLAPADRVAVLHEWRNRLMWDALVAACSRRTTHARVLYRAVIDNLNNVGGKCPVQIPGDEPTVDAIRRLGGFGGDRCIVMICDRPEFVIAAHQLRQHLRNAAQSGETPRFVEFVRNTLPAATPEADVERIVYSSKARSKIWRQLPLVGRKIAAVVVFDTAGDLPLVLGEHNVHVDCGSPEKAVVEEDRYRARAAFLVEWLWTRWRISRKGRQA